MAEYNGINIMQNGTDTSESDGNTSFLRAARNGQLEKVLEHLKTNIDINTSNANGLNALHLASKDGHVEIVEELLKRGAIVDAATKKGNTALHIASLAGQEEVVKLLVQHGASVNVQSQNGFTPLYMAAQENHDNVVKYLLANGANQSLSTEDGFTPLAVAMQQGHDKVVTVLLENDTRGKVRLPALHIAAKKDDVRAAKLLLENEHNPDVTSKSGFTPLHIASHYGNQSIANLLVQKGADVNYSAKHNITPLHVAAKWGKSNMVSLLLEQGAHIEAKTRDGLTPLHCAARSGHEQVVDMLLEKSAPISSKTKNGLAPLHMAAQGDHVEAARILLYHRAPVDEVTVDYLTALHVAAHCGHVRVAKLLLDRHADANARALNGFTPLHIACKKNRIKVVELLLKYGACIGATTESGLTPLHVASFMGCMNIVIYLLQHDASPDIPTVRGETPLHLAARANQTDIIRILLRNGAQVDARAREQQTPLHIASRLGNVDIVMLLLQHGAKVDNTTKDMYTALHIAAKEGQDEVAAVLIENGASLNATTKKGFTPLHLAAKYGHLKVAKLLVQKEAPVDAQGKNGVTPLHVASHYDHQNVALLLLDKGASPHANAKNGHTPLHIAARKNQMDIANTLLEYGALPDAESKAGFTPLHLSSQEGHTDITALLLEHKATPSHHSKNGLTPMHLCAQENRVLVAEILHENGADINASTKGGYTPLHIACHFGQADMVKFLLSKGANVKNTTSIGYTPLHQAAQQGHTNIVNLLLDSSAEPNAITNNGQTPLHIAQKLGYISVIDTLKKVTENTQTPTLSEDKYRVVAPEAMHETFLSDSEEEGEDTLLGDQTYRYLTADEMKSLGDDSLPIDVTRDERMDSNRMVGSDDLNSYPPRHIEDSISPEHIHPNYVEYIKKTPDNIDISRHPVNIGFLVSFLVDARGGAMRGCRHSGVRVIVPPRCAPSPTRITCRYVRPQRTPHPPPLMEGEALASRVLELGPVGAKFLGPVIIEVPHFAALRGAEREIVILRSDNGESWKEHTIEATEDVLTEVLRESFDPDDLNQLEDNSAGRITRIITQDFPQYFAVISRIRQEVHAIGPEGGMVSSTVVPQVQAVFPQGALTKKIKVGLQAQPIDPELTAKLLGHGVAVSPVVTVEPRRRKFHKAITLSMPAPRAHSQGMINQYSGSAPTLRLLCSITGGTSRAQWEDVTGSTPLTFVNDCVSFTTTVSARFWLMDCRNIGDATKMATELYREAIHVPFIAKFVVFAKRIDPLEARLRVFCMTDDKEEKTLEYQEQFTEIAKSRDVEVLEGKSQFIEFAGNLVPITKSGEQLQFSFRAFKENRLPFSVRVKDQHAEAVSRCLFMREPKVQKGEPPQQPICILNIVLPDDIISETISLTDSDSIKKRFYANENFDYYRQDPRLADMSNLLGEDWVQLANQLGLTSSEINVIKSEYPDSVAKQAQSMLRMWLSQSGNRAQTNTLDNALRRIGREDIIHQCLNVDNRSQQILRLRPEEKGKPRLKDDILNEEMSSQKKHYDANKKDDLDRHEKFDKYSAEEKVFEPSDEEEDFNKTVPERREQIVKRLSTERTIPASSQRVEIVQEISSIKRQSLVEDKIAEVQQKANIEPLKIGTVKPVSKIIQEKKLETESDTEAIYSTNDASNTSSDIHSDIPIFSVEATERRDSVLLEEVTQRLESKKPLPKLDTHGDPKSPKFSKTPPPSPADFAIRDRDSATVQEWKTPKAEHNDLSRDEPIKTNEDATDASCKQLTDASQTPSTNTRIPQPKPRYQKTKEIIEETLQDTDPHGKQISPVRDDLLDQSDQGDEVSYLDKKKFWENISKDSSKQPAEHILPMKRKSIHETTVQPVPKPRGALQSSFSVAETQGEKIAVFKKSEPQTFINLNDDEQGEKIERNKISGDEGFLGSNYQDSSTYQKEEITEDEMTEDEVPNKISPKRIIDEKTVADYQATNRINDDIPKSEITQSASVDSDEQNSSQDGDNAGYISDCGDVEHYISDSEIEDRVPQIRERQMSVFIPPSVSQRTRYERSASLPTEDLYEVSARSTKLRKQYYEEQIKKEMIKEQLTIDLEDETSPETKSIGSAADVNQLLESGTQEIVQENTSSMMKSECPASKETSNNDTIDRIHTFDIDNSKTIQGDLSERNQFQRTEEAVQPDMFTTNEEQLIETRSFNKNSKSICSLEDAMDIHVDKSETEKSEKVKETMKDINAGISRVKSPIDSGIPQITYTLSGKQRRISEESDEYAPKESYVSDQRTIELDEPQDSRLIQERKQMKINDDHSTEVDKSINQPEESITSTVWEVSVESEILNEERLSSLPSFPQPVQSDSIQPDEKICKYFPTEDAMTTTNEMKPELVPEEKKTVSDSYNDMKRIILDSLQQQEVDPEEAKVIANTLIEEIESEIQKVENIKMGLRSKSESSESDKHVSDYLKELAESKGLDRREVELVESVLERRHRQKPSLNRGDTQASSMEITDEDLRYSEGDLDYTHVLQQQMGQLEAECIDTLKNVYDSLIETHGNDENIQSDEAGKYDTKESEEHVRREKIVKVNESVHDERLFKDTKSVIFEEDETVNESLTEDLKHLNADVKIDEKEETILKTAQHEFETKQEATMGVNILSESQNVIQSVTREIPQHIENSMKNVEISALSSKIEESEVISEKSLDKITGIEISTSKRWNVDTNEDNVNEKMTDQFTSRAILGDGVEVIASITSEKSESCTISSHETQENIWTVVSSNMSCEDEIRMGDIMKRTSSSDSKSSAGSGKSPEENFSTCSSGKKLDSEMHQDVIFRKSKTDSGSDTLKSETRTGIDLESYSSSGESHYHSFEIDSKSRPCSSDIEGIIPTASSEYESALNSQELSSRSQYTSGEYHTAVSSLSSKESMRSFESESSGNLASIEVSEASETLVPTTSDLDGDVDIVDPNILDDTELLWPTNGDEICTSPEKEELAGKEKKYESMKDSSTESDKFVDIPSKMKRSYEMTFQPEPRVLAVDSQADSNENEERYGTSIDEGSVLSVSLSSTSSIQLRTVVERSKTESGGLEDSLTTSALSDNISLDDEQTTIKSTDAITQACTSTPTKEPVESVTILSANITENGVSNVCSQVTTETAQSDAHKPTHDELKKKGHRRQESSATIPSLINILPKQTDTQPKPENNTDEHELGRTKHSIFSEESTERVEGKNEYINRLESQERMIDLSIRRQSSERRDSHGKSSTTSSEKSSFEEAEAEAAFNMVAHISPVHKIKQICPIIEDIDAEKKELEAKEQVERERKLRVSLMKDASPGSIPDIKVTEHSAPLDETNFRYPELELERQQKKLDEKIIQSETPGSNSSKSSEDTEKEGEYVLEDQETMPPEENLLKTTESMSEITTVVEKTIIEEDKDRTTDSPNSDSFELVEKPDIIDDFVVIEEVAKEASEMDQEGKSVSIHAKPKRSRKNDDEIDAYLAKSDPTPLTKMTELRYYPENMNDELDFDFEDSPPRKPDGSDQLKDYGTEYDKELEANRKWIEQQFHGDQAAMAAAGYGYEMEYDRGPLEDIKEEDINDIDLASSRIGSLGSQKEYGASLGSVKDSYSSTPEYDVLAGKKYFTKSGDHDDISMSSLQEFESLEKAMSLETKKFHHGSGSGDSSSNGSFKTRYYANKGQGDDISVSSLKEFEGLERACIAVHKNEIKAKEEEELLSQIDEGPESISSEMKKEESFKDSSSMTHETDEEDYEKRIFEIEEIIKQAQNNVERFTDLKEMEKTESLGRGDSVEEVSKVPDLDLDAPLLKAAVENKWADEDPMVTSTDSLDVKPNKIRHGSTDSLEQKNDGVDLMTTSTDSIELNNLLSRGNITTDSMDTKGETSHMVYSDSLEGAVAAAAKPQTDSLEEDDLKLFHDHSSSDTGKDFSSSVKDDPAEHDEQLHELMLGSTDSLEPTSSAATHATYQYETDSVISGSFTSGGSNTMVSSTDTIDPNLLSREVVDISAAVQNVWFGEEASASGIDVTTEYFNESSMPYVTELIEPSDDEAFSHTIHRVVELPPEVSKITFHGKEAEKRMQKFINDFGESEEVEETEETDADGNIHVKRVVRKRYIVKSEGEKQEYNTPGEDIPSEISDSEVYTTTYSQQFAPPSSQLTSLTKSLTGDDSSKSSGSRDVSMLKDPSHLPEDNQTRQPVDQHQLSEEMKELLKEIAESNKQ